MWFGRGGVAVFLRVVEETCACTVCHLACRIKCEGGPGLGGWFLRSVKEDAREGWWAFCCFKLVIKNWASSKTQHYCILYMGLSSSASFLKNAISHGGFSWKCVFYILWDGWILTPHALGILCPFLGFHVLKISPTCFQKHRKIKGTSTSLKLLLTPNHRESLRVTLWFLWVPSTGNITMSFWVFLSTPRSWGKGSLLHALGWVPRLLPGGWWCWLLSIETYPHPSSALWDGEGQGVIPSSCQKMSVHSLSMQYVLNRF